MDGVGQWRLIEPQEGEKQEPKAVKNEPPGSRSSFLLIAATAALVIAAVGVAIWATLPEGGASVEQPGVMAGAAFVPMTAGFEAGGQPGATAPVVAAAAEVVIDVQGAVVRPGVHTLPEGSRVADAISAAGGYAATVDIAAASRQLNLAERLVDGAQVRVPTLGDEAEVVMPITPAEPGAGEPGLIDLNGATAEELDTLPGIGPVTAAKIVDARSQAPFAAVDELLTRGVVGAATFEKLRDLVTV